MTEACRSIYIIGSNSGTIRKLENDTTYRPLHKFYTSITRFALQIKHYAITHFNNNRNIFGINEKLHYFNDFVSYIACRR